MNRHKISCFGLALALLGLVACSDDGEQQYKDARHTPMTFTVTHPSQTRATATDFENGDRIGLYVAQADAPLEIGGNLVNNEALTHNGSSWTAARTFYWDDGTYNAYAYYPYMQGVSSIDDQPFSVATDQSTAKTGTTPGGYEASDLLFATTKGIKASASPINLTFKHIMSKIKIRLIKGEDFEGEMPATAGEKSGKAVNCTAAAFVFIIAAIIIQGSLRDGVTTWMPSYISETFSLGSDISVLSGVAMPIFAFLCIWGTEYLYYGIKDVQKCCLIYFSAALAAALLIPAAAKTGPALTVIEASVLVGSMHGINILQTCMLPRQIGNNNRIGLISGIFNGSVYIGSALSTYGFALVSDIFGWNGTVLVWSVFSALGVLICLLLTRLCKR